jgi:hypothetical protein
MTGTIQLSPVNVGDQDTVRTITVTITPSGATAANPPVTIVISAPFTTPATYTTDPGDSASIVDVDTNSVGASPPSVPFVAVTPAAPPATAVPGQPVVLGVTFGP